MTLEIKMAKEDKVLLDQGNGAITLGEYSSGGFWVLYGLQLSMYGKEDFEKAFTEYSSCLRHFLEYKSCSYDDNEEEE